ncbi:MAG: hypothetical protein COT81_04530 [Candidatus Buchananbacteria bacterium CG10_big_fil_rev_8_21_14_0_10_42_9]|uniref:Uncharacterized protein n=1 Tax=Candidatus Buchananbacteria bacterium CG10_big_fil_rev_8_21_14_0_10_42_9 TaxID=1974526 RepID=A0A2H0W086_9BACT|nr:MAG: hypothetical protein COT81_04530 [Candidatus Buchananbacteria bacterium CG10_big_fil_rev_8_21_14_0_10_42_9]
MSDNITNTPEYRRLQRVKERQSNDKVRKRKRRRRYGCWMVFRCSCFLLFWILILLIIAGVLAKSNLVQIPILTPLLNKGTRSAPTETATSTAPSETNAQNAFSLSFSEQTLTDLASGYSEGQTDPSFSNIEVDIKESTIGITGLMLKPFSTNFTLEAIPIIKENELGIEVQQFSVGEVSIPSFLVRALVNNLIEQQLKSVNDELGDSAQIDNIEISQDTLTISGRTL